MMSNENYPGLYRCADSASLNAQRTYFHLHELYLGSLVLGSAIGAAATPEKPVLNTWLFPGMAIVLAVGLLILWIARTRQDDKIWFDGRAVAESAKTATWRFMMKVPPFHEDNRADERFIAQLKEIREATPHLGKHMATVQAANGSSITDFMREKRAATLENRREFYVSDRLAEQRSWYAKKARLNATSSARWFWIIAGLQMAAVVLAVIQAVPTGLGTNVASVITTFAAAFAAWGLMKRYDELAQSYGLAAQELQELQSLARSQTAVEDFAQFVEQAENSISREHTIWCVRRDVPFARSGAH